MIKGFCKYGQIDRARALLDNMQRERDIKPDEVLYNSLLDGCAKCGQVDMAWEVY